MSTDSTLRVSIPIPRAPLVGREAELAVLDQALARAIALRRPETVTIVGGAGLGKTRLVTEFLARVSARERKARAFRGVAHQAGPTHGVVQRILRARFGITDHTDGESAREMLRAQVTQLLEDRRVT